MILTLLQDPKQIESGLNFIERNGIFGIFVVLLGFVFLVGVWFSKRLLSMLETFFGSLIKSQENQEKTLDRLCDLQEEQGRELRSLQSIGEETNQSLSILLFNKKQT